MPRRDREDEDDAALEASMQEAEYRRLQVELKKAEKEKQAYFLECQDQLRRQNLEIGLLDREREELVKNLRLVESKTNENKDKVRIEVLQSLAGQQDDKKQLIDDEMRAIAELDMKVAEWERKCRTQNKSMGGAAMAGLHVKKVQHQNCVLENRLDQALKKFNSQLVRNRQLRDTIDSLRVERSKYDALCERLDKGLEELKHEKQQIVEASTQAYEARDEAQQKMVVLREKAEKDRQQYETEIKELQRILDHDRKLKEFMGVKTQDRKEDPQQLMWKLKKERNEYEHKGDVQAERLMLYEDSFAKIKDIMKEDDLDIVVKRFIENEDTNFALFNFVNDQNNQSEILHEQIQEIRHKIEVFESEGVRREEERHVIMHELESKLNDIRRELDFVADKNKLVEKILDQLRAGVQSVFAKINCDRTAIEELLGSSEGVTMINLILYLGVVEQRTNELLAMQSYVQQRDSDFSDKVRGASAQEHRPLRDATTTVIDLVPPGITDDVLGTMGEDDEARPLTRLEIENRVAKALLKRDTARRDAQLKAGTQDATLFSLEKGGKGKRK